MLIFGRNLRTHGAWIALTALATLTATLWYAVASLAARSLVGGGSLPGFTFGVVGGLICLFEFLLWPRKKLRRLRLGRVQTWMKAHIWLGLLSLPLLVLHSGFRLGGALSATLMVLFVVVIASGVWGLALQNALPKKMLADVPAETIFSQIPRIIAQYRDEARRLVAATCGRPTPTPEAIAESAGAGEESTHYLVVGAVRSAGRIKGKVLETRALAPAVIGDSEPLRDFFDRVAEPFLTAEGFAGSPLRREDRAALLFDELEVRIERSAHPTIDALRGLCDQRRQLAEQERIHLWLHNWLAVHLPLSIALIVLMFVHIYEALRYL